MDEKVLRKLVDEYLEEKGYKIHAYRQVEREEQLDRIERMMRWLIAEMIHTDKDVIDEMRLKAVCNQPDISDILEEKE